MRENRTIFQGCLQSLYTRGVARKILFLIKKHASYFNTLEGKLKSDVNLNKFKVALDPSKNVFQIKNTKREYWNIHIELFGAIPRKIYPKNRENPDELETRPLKTLFH